MSKEHIRKNFFLAEYSFLKKHIKNKKVLVAGSGLGHDSIEIAKNNKEVVGIELIKEYVGIAKKKVEEQRIKNVIFKQGDFRHLPYKDNIFDVAVLNMGTISDFKDKASVLKELLRVAKKVYFDFYPNTKKGLEKRKKMYGEEGWKKVRIYREIIVSDDGLYSESVPKEKIRKIAKTIRAEVTFNDFCDFATIAKLSRRGLIW